MLTCSIWRFIEFMLNLLTLQFYCLQTLLNWVYFIWHRVWYIHCTHCTGHLLKKTNQKLVLTFFLFLLILCNCQNCLLNFTLIGWRIWKSQWEIETDNWNLYAYVCSVWGCHGFCCQFIDIIVILCDLVRQKTVMKWTVIRKFTIK